MEDTKWIWIEKIFSLIPLGYLFSSLIFGLLIYTINYLFITQLMDLNISDYNLVWISLSSAIALQLAGINYFYVDIKKHYCLGKNDSKMTQLAPFNCDFLKKKLKSKKIYIVVCLTIIPFILLLIYYQLLGIDMFFSQVELNEVNVLYDIYNTFIGYLLLYLLSISLWIFLNITLMIIFVSKNVDRVLKHDLFYIKNIYMNLIFYFSVSIILSLLSYSTPVAFIYYESYCLMTIYAIALMLFVYCWHTIKMIIKNQNEAEIRALTDLIQKKREQIFQLIYRNDQIDKTSFDLVSSELDLLYKELNQIKQSNLSVYNFRSMAALIASTFAAFIVFMDNLQKLQSNDLFNNILHYISYYVH